MRPPLACWMVASVMLALLAVPAACRSTGSSLQTQRIEYRDRLLFTWSFAPRNVSMQVKNLGPGTVTVELELRDGRTTKQDVAQGEAPYYMLQNLSRVEFLHPAPTTAAVEWSIDEELRKSISVRAE